MNKIVYDIYELNKSEVEIIENELDRIMNND